MRFHSLYEMRCAVWYHLYNLKNVKNIHEGVLLKVKGVFHVFELYKSYQTVKRTTYYQKAL